MTVSALPRPVHGQLTGAHEASGRTDVSSEGLKKEIAEKTFCRATAGAAYAGLRREVLAAGLLERAYGYYAGRILVTFLMWAAALASAFLLPEGWGWSGLAAVLIGFTSIQIGLIAHDAGHLEVFRSAWANWVLGSVCWSLSLGISFWYWYDRHNRHHGHTNDLQQDPEIQGTSLLAFNEKDVSARRGWRRAVAKYQALFSPLLIAFVMVFVLYLSLSLRVEGWFYALRRLRGSRRVGELALLVVNGIVFSLPLAALGWRWVGIFLASQFAAGLYLGLIVAPNHKGMPVWAAEEEPSFLERQVLSSRNIKPNPVSDFVYGGLNYQIEHHLFPTMPRVNLGRARLIVKAFCEEQGLSYEELDPLTSYRKSLAEIQRVGRAAG